MKTRDKMLGAGIGLAALAAAGAYFIYRRREAKGRARVSDWALQLKGEVFENMERLKEINQTNYEQLADETADRYGRLKSISAAELARIRGELKDSWKRISRQLNAPAR
jgi:NTP pyrophosphatase (non-canonical NTP hydrolase)